MPGEPTFGEWIRQNLDVSDRHVRRLLAAVKEPTDFSRGELEQAPKQQRRDEVMRQASRLAHAILGLDESDERDPSGLQRRAALTAMAYKFEAQANPVLVRLRELQPGNIRGLSAILHCLDGQMDQVFGSLDEPERSEALRLFADEIGNRFKAARAIDP